MESKSIYLADANLAELSLKDLQRLKQKLINDNRGFVTDIYLAVIHSVYSERFTEPGWSNHYQYCKGFIYPIGVIAVRVTTLPDEYLSDSGGRKLSCSWRVVVEITPTGMDKKHRVCSLVITDTHNIKNEDTDIFIPGQWVAVVRQWVDGVKDEIRQSCLTSEDLIRNQLLGELGLSKTI